jgi:hypothetical protein
MFKKLLFLGLAPLFAVATALAQAPTFPADWQGHWRGKLDIYKTSGVASQFPMQLIISSLDSARYRFALIYGEGEKVDERPYELLVIDPVKGHYRVDEKNSILIDARRFGPRLITWFGVGPSVLVVTYEKVGDTIVFEVISTGDKASTTSGGQSHQGQDIPAVNSYLANGYQRAVLRRE